MSVHPAQKCTHIEDDLVIIIETKLNVKPVAYFIHIFHIYNIPYPILLNYWKKRISTVLQIGNISIISEAYRRLFNFGAETLQRDYYEMERNALNLIYLPNK